MPKDISLSITMTKFFCNHIVISRISLLSQFAEKKQESLA